MFRIKHHQFLKVVITLIDEDFKIVLVINEIRYLIDIVCFDT
jgi:hypothetical protein